MELLHRTRADWAVTAWSGGTTAELLLWPPEGSYKARDFLFRLSSATVEAEDSVFTALPGVERYITPLRGGFTLTHEGRHRTVLTPYEIDRFWGDWRTDCRGRATDFNLMLRGCAGELRALRGPQRLALAPAAHCFFFPEGGALTAGGTVCPAARDDLWAVFPAPGETVTAEVAGAVVLYARADISQI